MRISDWSSDVCSSDLAGDDTPRPPQASHGRLGPRSHIDLMAGPPPTHLPVDPAAADLEAGTAPSDVVRRHPESPAAWAALAAEAKEQGADDVSVYAYARVGYHRSLDMLRRNGWKGHGPVPWDHERSEEGRVGDEGVSQSKDRGKP